MKQKPLLLAALLLAFLISGCIEFKRQTLSYRHDAAGDTLYIFQDYQGIFGGENEASLTDDEIRQFDSLWNGERTFFFNNWITEYNRDTLLEMKHTPAGDLDPDPAYEKAMRTLADVALTNVNVENVGLYWNTDKELCGAQRVTVRNLSKVFTALNEVIRFAVREEAGKDEKTAEERKLFLGFFERGEMALRLDGNRLEIRIPVPEADYNTWKAEDRQAIALRESGAEFSYAEGTARVAVGTRDARMVSFTLPFSDNPYSDNAEREARKRGIKDTFDAKAAAEAFLQ